MSKQDVVGTGITPGAVPPGGSEDPEPYSSAYFVLWGFVLLLAMVLGLQYLAWDAMAAQGDRSSGSTATGPAAEARAEQEARMPGLKAAMRKVVKESSAQ